MNQTRAYMDAYPDSSPEAARSSACDLLANPNIEAEIEAIRQKADSLPGSAVLSYAEKRETLARIVRSCPKDASFDNPDCNLVMTKAGPVALFPDKLAAIKLDNELAGDAKAPVMRLELIASCEAAPPPLDALDVESVVSREGEPQRGDS